MRSAGRCLSQNSRASSSTGMPCSAIALEVRRVHALLGQAVDVDEKLGGPVDRLLLEVVAKRPVAEHLEERVVVRVFADIVEVVVLAAGTNALLRVDGTLQIGKWRIGVTLTSENLETT
jgi:hypothetical protein